MKKSIVIFGAGNIGRSFIGQLFSKGGYKVTFIDTNKELVSRLNEEGKYSVILKKDNVPDRILTVEPVSAIDGTDHESVAEALYNTDLAATAVGLRALPYVVPSICKALSARINAGLRGFDVILAENIHNGKEFFLEEASKYLPEDFPVSDAMGIVECSIGKMVPIMKNSDLAEDPLQIFAEEYSTLILDGTGFVHGCPSLEGLMPVSNIKAYVDRKLYIHNLGHAAVAYYGYLHDKNLLFIADALAVPEVHEKVMNVMSNASILLRTLYPGEFTEEDVQNHIDDLLGRFGNKALGDTVFRIGRDLARKLNRNDRVLGAALKAFEAGTPFESFLDVYNAGLKFRAKDESGNLFPADESFLKEAENMTPAEAAVSLCGLRPEIQEEAKLLKALDK